MVSIKKAAEILGVHPETIRRWTNKGILKCYKTKGNHRRFKESELQTVYAEMFNLGKLQSEMHVLIDKSGQILDKAKAINADLTSKQLEKFERLHNDIEQLQSIFREIESNEN